MEQASDLDLLTAARNGDQRALTAIIERHQAQVYRFGLKMCRDPEDAREVLQETLLTMARGIRDFRGSSSLSTWLYAVARSFCIKKRRRSKFAPEESSLDAAPGVAASVATPDRDPEQFAIGQQVERALERAIESLDPAYREVLVLRDMEGLTAAEVAEVAGITVQAVKSRLHRARQAVRAAVAPFLTVPVDAKPAPGSCPDVVTLFSQHLEDEIGPAVCSEMERHLELCPRCRSACDSLKRTLELCRTVDSTADVPPAVQAAVKQAVRDFLEAPTH